MKAAPLPRVARTKLQTEVTTVIDLLQIIIVAFDVAAVVLFVRYVRQIDREIADSRRHLDIARRRNDLADARWQKLMDEWYD